MSRVKGCNPCPHKGALAPLYSGLLCGAVIIHIICETLEQANFMKEEGQMKGSLRISKGSAKHITHSFEAEHIDKERTEKNIYWTWKNDITTADNIEADELEFYEKNYGEYLNKQNEKYKQKRQYKRMKTLKEYYEANKPDEMILQIGKMGETVDPDLFYAVVNEWLGDFKEKYSNNVHILSYAVHNDEATPHIHIRFSYDYLDNDVKRFGINKALDALGFEKPKTGKEDRYNNKKITFTDQLRTAFYDFCELFGIEINRTVENPSHRYLEAQLFKAQRQKEENERNKVEFKKQIEELEKEIEQLETEKEEARQYYNDKKLSFKEVKEDIDKNYNDAVENYRDKVNKQLEHNKQEMNDKASKIMQDFKADINKYIEERKNRLLEEKLKAQGLTHEIHINDFSR